MSNTHVPYLSQCIFYFRYNKRQKRQNIAMLKTTAILPALHRTASAPLPSAVTRQPTQPAQTIQILFPPNTSTDQPSTSHTVQKSARYRAEQLKRADPNRRQATKSSYVCKHCGKPKTADYGHKQPRKGKWYCLSFGDIDEWKRQNNLL